MCFTREMAKELKSMIAWVAAYGYLLKLICCDKENFILAYRLRMSWLDA